MSLKEFFTIKMLYFRSYPYIPSFHSDGINSLPLNNLYLLQVIEFIGQSTMMNL